MDVILLERIEKLGAMGDVVSVKPGFARNFLLPQKKALRATAENAAKAAKSGEAINGSSYIIIRNAGETGQLYGSVTARDVSEVIALSEVKRSMIVLEQPIKALGLHQVKVRMHADVTIEVTVNVSRSEDEAVRQAAGEDVIATQMESDKADEREAANERAELAIDMFEGDREADFGDNAMPEESAPEAPAEDA